MGFTLALWERAETVRSGLLQHCEKAETEREPRSDLLQHCEKEIRELREPSRLQAQSIVGTSHKAKGAVVTEPVSHLWLANSPSF